MLTHLSGEQSSIPLIHRTVQTTPPTEPVSTTVATAITTVIPVSRREETRHFVVLRADATHERKKRNHTDAASKQTEKHKSRC